MRSITTFDLQYAHRFYGFQGEAQYLHGHTGVLTIEVEDSVNMGVNMVYSCNEIQKVAWDVLKNFDHALVLRQDDPLLPAVLDVYEKQGIKNGHPQNTMKGAAFSNELCTADIAVTEGLIVGMGDYSGKREVDVTGKIVCPGFLDAHIHLESSLVSPSEFVRAVLPHGTTTVITDPHEIANVMGTDGIEYMLQAT